MLCYIETWTKYFLTLLQSVPVVACSDSRDNINPLVVFCLVLTALSGTQRSTWTSRNTTAELESKAYRYDCSVVIERDWLTLEQHEISTNVVFETDMWTFKGGRPHSFDRDRCNDPRPLRRHFYVMCWHRTDRGDVICSAVSRRIRPCLLFRDQRKWVEGNS